MIPGNITVTCFALVKPDSSAAHAHVDAATTESAPAKPVPRPTGTWIVSCRQFSACLTSCSFEKYVSLED